MDLQLVTNCYVLNHRRFKNDPEPGIAPTIELLANVSRLRELEKWTNDRELAVDALVIANKSVLCGSADYNVTEFSIGNKDYMDVLLSDKRSATSHLALLGDTQLLAYSPTGRYPYPTKTSTLLCRYRCGCRSACVAGCSHAQFIHRTSILCLADAAMSCRFLCV